MAQIAKLSALEERVKHALEAFCMSKGALPDEFQASVFRRYYDYDLDCEVVSNFFKSMDWFERRKAVDEFMRRHLAPEDYKEIAQIYFTSAGAYRTREEQNEEGLHRMEYSRV